MKALIERLLKCAEYLGRYDTVKPNEFANACKEAADALERLTAERDALLLEVTETRGELDQNAQRFQEELYSSNAAVQQNYARVVALTAERDALKAALQLIQANTNTIDWPDDINAAIQGVKPMTNDWKLMPKNATHKMLKAMDECSTEGYDERLYAGHASSVYTAAWGAAPEQAAPTATAQQEFIATATHSQTHGRIEFTGTEALTELLGRFGSGRLVHLYADAEQMYKRGWINAARWADRADLIADIDSGAYAAELDAAIQGAKHD